MKKIILLFISFFFIQTTYSQYLQLSVYSEVSMVTVGPGENLYEVFGHSSIRIKDPVLRLDLVYNYGIFDFTAPNFYTNFAKGKLIYKLVRYPFQDFVEGNKRDKRWIKEQVLQLNQGQCQQFFEFLENNARKENASYLYDPFFNNCATKLIDVSNTILKDSIILNTDYVSNKTLRQLMNDELHWNTWGSTGINIALGSLLDQKATPSQYMYLPDFVYLALKKGNITVNGKDVPIVKKEHIILDFEEPKVSFSLISPVFIFSVLLCIGLFITFRDIKRKKRTKWLDFLLFFITGFTGVGIIFLWFFTDHATTPDNFNVLWAFAPNLIVAFFVLKKKLKPNIRRYLQFLLLLLLVLVLFWIFGIQLFAVSLIPFFLLLAVRYYTLLASVK